MLLISLLSLHSLFSRAAALSLSLIRCGVFVCAASRLCVSSVSIVVVVVVVVHLHEKRNRKINQYKRMNKHRNTSCKQDPPRSRNFKTRTLFTIDFVLFRLFTTDFAFKQ